MQVLVIGGIAAVISILAGIYTRPGVVRFDEKYYLALAKNLDPDKPRNLAKSVTVK